MSTLLPTNEQLASSTDTPMDQVEEEEPVMMVFLEKGRSSHIAFHADSCMIARTQKSTNLIMRPEVADLVKLFIHDKIKEHYGSGAEIDFNLITFATNNVTNSEEGNLIGFRNIAVKENTSLFHSKGKYIIATLIFWKKAGQVRARFVDVAFHDDLYQATQEANATKLPVVNVKAEDVLFNGFNPKNE